MPMSNAWSSASPNLRLEVWPSRWLAASLVTVGVLGACGLFLSDLPWPAAAVAAVAVVAWALTLARRTLRRPAMHFAFRGDGRVSVDEHPVDDVGLEWRGPLTCIQWREAKRRRYFVGWPDRIDAAARRELRLWRLAHRADASTRPVAP